MQHLLVQEVKYMKADEKKPLGLLLLGFVSILLLASFSLEDSQVATIPISSSSRTDSKFFNLQTVGIFHPLTDEYLRQQTKELPYHISEAPSEPERPKVFEQVSPLELALLSEGESASPRKKKMRQLPVGDFEGGNSWKPLSEEERQTRERELAKRALDMGVELADSLYMPYFSDGLLWTTQRFNAYRHYLTDQYRLHLKVSGEDATVTYRVKY